MIETWSDWELRQRAKQKHELLLAEAEAWRISGSSQRGARWASYRDRVLYFLRI